MIRNGLGETEQAALRQAVLDDRPCDVGLSGQLRTWRLVGELIAKLYRVRLTEVGVGKYLKRWGLSLQRPDKRAVEQDPQAVRRWHEETWPVIRAKAKRGGGEVSCSPIRSASARTRSPAGPGVKRGRPPWCGGAATASR
nr:winged helix-turn-helix domain-containing protein [Streptomyces sp. SID8359]